MDIASLSEIFKVLGPTAAVAGIAFYVFLKIHLQSTKMMEKKDERTGQLVNKIVERNDQRLEKMADDYKNTLKDIKEHDRLQTQLLIQEIKNSECRYNG